MDRTAPIQLDDAGRRLASSHDRQLKRQFKLALFVVVVLAVATVGMMLSFTPTGEATHAGATVTEQRAG